MILVIEVGKELYLRKSLSDQHGIHTRVTRIEPIPGGTFPKYFAVGEQKHHQLHIVVKQTLAEGYYAQYQALKAAGVPVIDSMRIVDKTHIAMTDLHAQGAVLFGKEMAFALLEYSMPFSHASSRNMRRTLTHHVVDTFLQKTQDEKALVRELQTYADKATKAGIALPEDEWFELVTYPSGITRWMVLDLDLMVGIGKREAQGVSIQQRNSNFVESTRDGIRAMRRVLLSNDLDAIKNS